MNKITTNYLLEIIENVNNHKSFCVDGNYEFNYVQNYDSWICSGNSFSKEELLVILGGDLMKNKKIVSFDKEEC